MAATSKTGGSTVVALAAAMILALVSFLSFAGPSAACGCKYCPCPTLASPAASVGKCPVDALKLGVCADVLGGLVNLLERGPDWTTASSKKQGCCELVAGLADLDATVCLCTAVKANVLGVVNLDLPVQLSLLVNHCGKKIPGGFQCPN